MEVMLAVMLVVMVVVVGHAGVGLSFFLSNFLFDPILIAKSCIDVKLTKPHILLYTHRQ